MGCKMSFFDMFMKKEESVQMKSLRNSYRIMNYLRDAYIKREKAYVMNSTRTTQKYFDDRLDAIVEFRRNAYNQFLFNCATATNQNAQLIATAKNLFFEEFKREYPREKFASVDEILDFDNDMNFKFKPLDQRFVNMFTAMVSGEKTDFTKFEALYMQLMNLYAQESANQQYYDMIKAVFNQTNEYGRDMIKDSYFETNATELPSVYSVQPNTYFVSNDILTNFSVIANALYKQQSKLDASQVKYIAYLESKLSKAKSEVKAKEIESLLVEARENRANNLLWLNSVSNLKTTLDAIGERKVGLNEMLDDSQLKINHIINSTLLVLFTTDKIFQINFASDNPRKHLIVHEKEIDSILENGKLLFSTIIPSMELASLTGKTITIEKELVEYSVDVLKHIYNRNVEKVQSVVTELAKAENLTMEEKMDTMELDQLIALGFDSKTLSSIRFQTPNGTFAYTGDAIYHFESQRKLSVEWLDNIPKLFGIEPEMTIEDRLMQMQSTISSIEKQGLTETEYENKVIEAINGGGNSNDL